MLPPTQRRRTPSLEPVDDVKGTENAERQRLRFMLSPTYTSLLARVGFMRWAILAKDESFLGGVYVCQEDSDESDNQLATLPVLPDRRHSTLCLTCMSRRVAGRVSPSDSLCLASRLLNTSSTRLSAKLFPKATMKNKGLEDDLSPQL
jgi:hypothetical protein